MKTYSSTRKLDSLPIGSRVSWDLKTDDRWAQVWTKTDGGWADGGSFTKQWPYDAKNVLAWNGNRPFRVLRALGEEV